MKQQFKGSLKRQFNQGTLSDGNVPFKKYTRSKKYNRKKPKPPPKTRWERIKDWLYSFIY